MSCTPKSSPRDHKKGSPRDAKHKRKPANRSASKNGTSPITSPETSEDDVEILSTVTTPPLAFDLDRFSKYVKFTRLQDILNDMNNECNLRTVWQTHDIIGTYIPLCSCGPCVRNLDTARWWFAMNDDQRKINDIWNAMNMYADELKRLRKIERALRTISAEL